MSFQPQPFEHGQHLAGEGLVEFDQVDVGRSFRPGALRTACCTAGTGPMPMRDGSQPAAAQPTSQPIGSRPSSASLSSATTRQAAAASFCWLALPAVTVPSFISGLQLAPAIPAWSSARTPSSRAKTTGSPFFCGTLTGTTSSSKRPAAQACAGALVAAQRVGVGGLARDLVVARQVLGGLDHAGDARRSGSRAGERSRPRSSRSCSVHRARARAPAHVGGVVLDVAHALDAAGDARHRPRRVCTIIAAVDDGLQPAAAAAVELHSPAPRSAGRPAAPTQRPMQGASPLA